MGDDSSRNLASPPGSAAAPIDLPKASRPGSLARVFVAFLLSPPAATLAFHVGLSAIPRGFADGGGSLLILAIAYVATLFVAVPTYLVMRRLGLLRAWQMVLGGGLVASASAFALVRGVSSDEAPGLAACVFLPGCVAGLTFWWIAHRRGDAP